MSDTPQQPQPTPVPSGPAAPQPQQPGAAPAPPSQAAPAPQQPQGHPQQPAQPAGPSGAQQPAGAPSAPGNAPIPPPQSQPFPSLEDEPEPISGGIPDFLSAASEAPNSAGPSVEPGSFRSSAGAAHATEEDVMETPLGVPEAIRPQGADQWVSEGKSKVSTVKAEETNGLSEQSKRMIEFIEKALHDERVTQIDGYSPGKMSVQFQGSNRLVENMAFSSEEEYTAWMKGVVDHSQSVISWEKIEEDRMGVLELPGGERFCIFLPPLARNYPTFSLRKHTAVQWTPSRFVELGTLDTRMLGFLQRCVAAHVNVLFVGQMGSGKTSLLRAMTQSSVGDNEKLAIVEQVPELSINKPLVTEYVYQPTVEGLGLGEVLDFNLYNGLSRLIVGEVHLEGITKMLETMILTEGSMSTYHAFSTEQAGERMKLALQMENANVSGVTAVSFLRQAIELVVVLEKVDDVRRVMQISEIDWRSSSGKEQLSGSDLFHFDPDTGRFRANGREPDEKGRVRAKLAKYNVAVPQEWFFDKEHIERFSRNPNY